MVKTTIVKRKEMPPVLPHGWKKVIAGTLGIHINTVSKALKAGKGASYDRIMKTALETYGQVTETENR